MAVKRITLSLSSDLHSALLERADKCGEQLATYINHVLIAYMENSKPI